MSFKELSISINKETNYPVLYKSEISCQSDLDTLCPPKFRDLKNYIFCCIAEKDLQNYVYFGLCKRHTDLEPVIKKEIGIAKNIYFGQINFETRENKFVSVTLHSQPGNSELKTRMNLVNLMEKINPIFLDKKIPIGWKDNLMAYEYSSLNKTIKTKNHPNHL